MKEIKVIVILILLAISFTGCASTREAPGHARLPRDLVEWWARCFGDLSLNDTLTESFERGSLGTSTSPREASYAFITAFDLSLSVPRPRVSPVLYLDTVVVPELLNYIDDSIPEMVKWIEKAEKYLAQQRQKAEEEGWEFNPDIISLWDAFGGVNDELMTFYRFRGSLAVLGTVLGCGFDDVWRSEREDAPRDMVKQARLMIDTAREFEGKLLALLGTVPQEAEKRQQVVHMLDDIRKLRLGSKPELGYFSYLGGSKMSIEEYEKLARTWEKLVKEVGKEALPLLLERILKRETPKTYLVVLSRILGIVTQYETFAACYCGWPSPPQDALAERIADILLEKEISRLERLVTLLRKHWKKANNP